MKNKKMKKIIFGLSMGVLFGMSSNVFATTCACDMPICTQCGNKVPDTFTTNTTDKTISGYDVTMFNRGFVLAVNNNVIDYHTDSASGNMKIYCYDRTLAYTGGVLYKKTEETVPGNLLRVIEKGYNGSNIMGAGITVSNANNYEASWITQSAIWNWQAGLKLDPSFVDDNLLSNPGTNDGAYSNRAIELWKNSQELAGITGTAMYMSDDSYNILTDGDYKVNADNKTLVTPTYKVGATRYGTYENVSIGTSKFPQGTKGYYADNTEITDFTSVKVADLAKGFYFVVPLNSVDNYSVDFNITFSGKHIFIDGAIYRPVTVTEASAQPVVLPYENYKEISDSINIKSSKVPDTASSVSKSIYFVGFIILLSGAGIIYANVKPKKEEV